MKKRNTTFSLKLFCAAKRSKFALVKHKCSWKLQKARWHTNFYYHTYRTMLKKHAVKLLRIEIILSLSEWD